MIAILCSVTALLNRSSVLYCDLKVVCKDFELAIENYSFRVRVTGVVTKIVNVAMSGMDHNVNTTNFTQNNHWHYKVVVKIEYKKYQSRLAELEASKYSHLSAAIK